MPQHPETLGKYQITGVIGEGAMGVVYRGWDPDIERTVAIKTIRSHASEAGVTLAARFRNEAQAGGRLMHPGIVSVYEYGEAGPIAFIAMEFVEGANLAGYLARKVRFGDEDILSLLDQLLDALGHAHAHGVLHRDIKPGNLIVTRQGRLKVADFGIARIGSLQLTKTNMVIGTPSQMAPEQFHGGPLDHRVDLYAAGAVLYELLAGRAPFAGDAHSLMHRILHDLPAPPSQVDTQGRSDAFDAVVVKALAKDPAQRHADAAAFRAALVAVAGRPPNPQLSPQVVHSPAVSFSEAGPRRSSTARAVDAGSPSGLRGPWTTAPPADWDVAALARVEAALAEHLGPMARVLVRRAARQCADEASLRLALAPHIADVTARARFITPPARPPAGSGSRPAAASASTPGGRPVSSSGSRPVSGSGSRPASASGSGAGPNPASGATAAPASTPVAPAGSRSVATPAGRPGSTSADRSTSAPVNRPASTSGSRPPTSGSRPAGTGMTASGATGGGPADDALGAVWLDAVLRVLTRHIGPIAKLIVKQAGSRAATREEFLAAVAERLPEAAPRERILVELQRL